ncbi:hypothetical protein [Cloacibacillus sp. An23]|nr:hypothetical protein [Cloacibacillus sp. An23]
MIQIVNMGIKDVRKLIRNNEAPAEHKKMPELPNSSGTDIFWWR